MNPLSAKYIAFYQYLAGGGSSTTYYNDLQDFFTGIGKGDIITIVQEYSTTSLTDVVFGRFVVTGAPTYNSTNYYFPVEVLDSDGTFTDEKEVNACFVADTHLVGPMIPANGSTTTHYGVFSENTTEGKTALSGSDFRYIQNLTDKGEFTFVTSSTTNIISSELPVRLDDISGSTYALSLSSYEFVRSITVDQTSGGNIGQVDLITISVPTVWAGDTDDIIGKSASYAKIHWVETPRS